METTYTALPSVAGLISLSDPSWGLLHIQMRLGIKESAARRLVNEPGFPKPIVNEARNRRWLPADVESFLVRKSSGDYETSKPQRINAAYQPKSISYKNRNGKQHG